MKKLIIISISSLSLSCCVIPMYVREGYVIEKIEESKRCTVHQTEKGIVYDVDHCNFYLRINDTVRDSRYMVSVDRYTYNKTNVGDYYMNRAAKRNKD